MILDALVELEDDGGFIGLGDDLLGKETNDVAVVVIASEALENGGSNDLLVGSRSCRESGLVDGLYCAVDNDPLDGEPRSFLWESYNSEDVEFIPENGESLCELNSFVPSIENNMLKVELETSNGTKSTIRMALRTGGAAK